MTENDVGVLIGSGKDGSRRRASDGSVLEGRLIILVTPAIRIDPSYNQNRPLLPSDLSPRSVGFYPALQRRFPYEQLRADNNAFGVADIAGSF
jgi:hypothetical protein